MQRFFDIVHLLRKNMSNISNKTYKMETKVIKSLLVLLCVAIVASCSSDDKLQLTNVDGKPSSVKMSYNDGTDVFFSYQEGRLSEIKEIRGSVSSFKYENDELVSISGRPEDDRVADGKGIIKFRKEGENRIIAEFNGEPDFNMYRYELELDENNIPVKITDLGIFAYTDDNRELSQVREGLYYAVFTYDEATKNLTQLVVYDKTSSSEVATHDYEYDNNTGAVSKTNLPLWYHAYRAFMNRDYRYGYNMIFFNYYNNLIKESVSKAGDDPEQNTYNYIYTYNKNNAPISMGSDTGDMSIAY